MKTSYRANYKRNRGNPTYYYQDKLHFLKPIIEKENKMKENKKLCKSYDSIKMRLEAYEKIKTATLSANKNVLSNIGNKKMQNKSFNVQESKKKK